MLTFFISGIWHGAKWTFIAWGVVQGIILSIEALTNKKKSSFEKKYDLTKRWWYIFISIIITFILFSSSLVISLVPTIQDSKEIFDKIFNDPGDLFIGSRANLIFSIFGLSILLIKDFMEEFAPSKILLFENKYKYIRVLSYSFVIILILLIGVFDGGQFIYFQF